MRSKPPTPEAILTRSVKQLLKAAGIFHWKQYQTLGSHPGVSDILGCYRGRMIAIELKAPRGTVTPDQERFIQNVNDAGGIAFVAKSLDEVIEGLGLQDRFLMFGGGKEGATWQGSGR